MRQVVPGDHAADRSSSVRPFLRWAGGKRWLTRRLADLLPDDYETYHEPFLGSGALFFAIHPSPARLSDSNRELTNTFRVVRDSCSTLVEALGVLRYTKSEYYRIRESRPTSNVSRAVRFIYLNRTCWNGLYRVNQAGEFNVPMGRRPSPVICDKENLQGASDALRGVEIGSRDFGTSLREVRKGDLVFADPPYTVSHGENGFILYNEKIFSWEDQERLSRHLRSVDKKGARFLLTNADHPSIRMLYRRFQTHRIERSSIIAADPKGRRRVSELVIANYNLPSSGFAAQ